MAVDVYGREQTAFRILDHLGRNVPFQRTSSSTGNVQHDEMIGIVFVAQDVPSLGYATYYVVFDGAVEQDSHTPLTKVKDRFVMEDNFYRIELAPGGISKLYDKELGKEILCTDKFLGGELFSMRSEGNGAGEFSSVQQPDMEGFEKLSDYIPRWNIIEDGPIRTVLRAECVTSHCTVVQSLVLYHTVKRIDFEVELLGWDGTNSREYRLAFPLAMKDKCRIAYDAPMGAVEVGVSEIEGAAGERYTDICSEVHPREVQDWFHASCDGFGVTMSSSVAVFDWVDPTDDPTPSPILQPLLLASRRSCHGEGNWYLQAGDHRYKFSLNTHKGNWRTGFVNGVRTNNPLIAVTHPGSSGSPLLPETISFVSTDDSNVVVSAVKKSEDDDDVVVRAYEIAGNDTETAIRMFVPVESAFLTDLIEENPQSLQVRSGSVPLTIGHHAIETMKLKTVKWSVDERDLLPPEPPVFDPPGGVYVDDKIGITMNADSQGVEIRYTTDGSEPTSASTLYTNPIVLSGNVVLSASTFRSGVSASKPMRANYRIGLNEPIRLSEKQNGIRWSYFEGSWETMPDFSKLEPLKQGTASNFGVEPAKGTSMEQFGLHFEGLIEIPRNGVYTFYIESDDGGMLYVDGQLIADNNGRHWPEIKSGDIGLKKGLHSITVDFFEAGGGETLAVTWSGPGFEATGIPGKALFSK